MKNRSMFKWGTVAGIATTTLPFVAFAADATFIIMRVQTILNSVIPVIFTIALIYFLWSLAMFIFKAGEEKDDAREHMIYGIIALAVMLGVWGLVGIILNTFGIQSGGRTIGNYPQG